MKTCAAPERADAPFSEVSGSHLLRGDCLRLLALLPDESVDCIITDPPYGIQYQSRSQRLPKTTIANDGPEAYALLDKALAIAVRKLKANSHIYVFTNWQAYAQMDLVVRRYFTVKNMLVWVKNARTRGDLKANYAYRYELVLYAHKGRRYLSGRSDDNVLFFNRVYSNRMQHPTEKPVELLEYLITKSTAEGETVLDMFAGSGSTCVAAKRLNRQYIGMELDRVWFEVAQTRVEGCPA